MFFFFRFTDGFNGTIFTYGQVNIFFTLYWLWLYLLVNTVWEFNTHLQTGSGKTHTICGTNVDEGRGIIPRSFQRLFDIMATKSREGNIWQILIFNL